MKTINSLLLGGVTALLISSCARTQAPEPTVKDAFRDKFLMGVAMNVDQIAGRDSACQAIAAKHFNAIVAENCMKSAEIHPKENEYNWADADAFVKFGEDNGMFVVGHCLVWHEQLSPWLLYDSNGQWVDAETLKGRIRDHITTIVGRYKGRVKGWDVVNEAIMEDGSYRNSPFYQIIGEEFIPFAFECAHAADPDAELYYNDYGMHEPGRRDAVVKLVTDMKKRGLRVDGIGMQAHMGLDYPDLGAFEKSLEAFAATGCKVMITELDMTALPSVTQTANVSVDVDSATAINPYVTALPDDVAKQWNDRMCQVFDLLVKHSDAVSRVNLWGINDTQSWRNDWPVKGRTDYPLAFDRQNRMKPFLSKHLNPIK